MEKLGRIKKKLFKGLLFVGMSMTIMGNDGCQQPVPEVRQLRRRVLMGKIDAPEIELPAGLGNQKFNFGYVANMQMYDILRKTQSFSTANGDPSQSFDPSDLNNDAQADFNKCEDSQEMQVFDTSGNAMFSPLSKTTISKSAACLIDMPQAIISGGILDFQLIGGGGISLGLANIKFLQALDFSFERYELSVLLKAKSPMEIGDHYFSTTVKSSYGNKMGVGATLNLGMLTMGPKFYFQTPLATVVDDGLTQAVTELRDNWASDDPWYAMVLKACDKYLYINGGYGNDAGLKVGDIVKINNVNYFWEGDACHSKLKGEIPMQPVAYAKIISVGRNLSAAEIIERDPNYPHSPEKIYPGARVYMEKMVTPPPAKGKIANQ